MSETETAAAAPATTPANWNERFDWLYKEMELHLARQDATRRVNYQRATWTLLTSTAFVALSGAAKKPQLQGVIGKIIQGRIESEEELILIIGLLLIVSFVYLFLKVIQVYLPRNTQYPFSLLGKEAELGRPVSKDEDPVGNDAFNRARWDEAIKQYFIPEDQFRSKILIEYIRVDTEQMVQISRMTKHLNQAFIAMCFVALFSLLLFLI